jgi:hypothetical protein
VNRIPLRRLSGEYLVIWSNNPDFLKPGQKIIFGDEPPLGPMGRKTRRSAMYAHNRRLAARRAKKASTQAKD